MEVAKSISFHSFPFRRLLKCRQPLSFSDHSTDSVAPKYVQQEESFENEESMFSFPDLKRRSNAFTSVSSDCP
jgi:hypothetical protein